MRVLQLCKKFPYPLKDGESIAVNNLSKALVKQGCELTLLAMNTEKHYAEIPDCCPELSHYKQVHSVYVDNSLNAVDAFINLVNNNSYHISRFVSKEFEEKLIEVLKTEDFDIIQLETSYLSFYIDTIRQHSQAKIAMRSHNIEFEIWERIAENTKTGLKSWYLNKCAQHLREYELSHFDKYDLIISITNKDRLKYLDLGYKKDILASPAGLDINDYNFTNLNKESSIGFIGSLDWRPNLNGLTWFLENVWTLISEKNPNLKFHIAGRNVDEDLLHLNVKNVIVEGEVESAKDFMSNHNILVVPLLSGSGIRIKILESLAMGRTVISTSIGAEGINFENGEHLLLADTPQQFLEAVQYCLKNESPMAELATKGRKLVEEKYNNIVNAQKLTEKYYELVGKEANHVRINHKP